jgi:hypothetical protein
MALHVRIEPVEKSVEATIRADLSPATQKQEAAKFAKAGIDQADAINRRILGRDAPRTITVDGHKNARLESVNPDGGNITAEWELVDGLLRWIGDTLIERSPHLSGAYKRGHTLYADGTEVPIGGRIPDADEYVFANHVPYARRLEVGKTKAGRPFLIEVPNKIYWHTARDARNKFGNQADIKYTMRDMKGASGSRKSIGRKNSRRGGSTDTTSPAIVIKHRKD